MEWLAEAEESEAGTEGEPEEAEPESGELEELMPQEGEEGVPQAEEGAELSEQENGAAPETDADNPEGPSEDDASAEGEVPEVTEEAQPTDEAAASGEDIGGLENAVLDDAFSSAETEGEPEEPPTFAPMTADNLESLSVPEET